MYSDDKGKTWTKPEDISEDIYSIFDDSSTGPAKSMFVTSGRIVQSKYVKVGKYYRLYCAVLQIKGDDTWVNFVLYSDDFGKSWNVLGDIETAGIPHDANEAKVEELPGGDILLSSRTDLEGRLFNIYKFDDIKKATGSWGTMAHSSSHNNGTVTEKNSCNGELLVIPARRDKDGKKVAMLLQSAPIGPKRANVGIYYKALELDREYTPEEIAADWEGVFRVTNIGSAYSVMAELADGKVGFAYEEKTYYPTSGAGYTIVYDAFSIEEITGGAYVTAKK
jgi:sialidase-1